MDAKQNISSIRHFLTMRHTDCDAFAEMGLEEATRGVLARPDQGGGNR